MSVSDNDESHSICLSSESVQVISIEDIYELLKKTNESITALRKEVKTLKSAQAKTKIPTKKDKNAPKKPQNQYMMFRAEMTETLNENDAAFKKLRWPEKNVEIGRMWREDYPDFEDRQKWKDKADQDSLRYSTEKAAYTATK